MKLQCKNKEIMVIITILVLQTIIFLIAGIKKSYLNIDEAYSYGLASYDKIEIQQNDDFFDTWHNKEYYEDYLTVNENEKNNYIQVYENQKNDVHPPLYYLLLRIAMGMSVNGFSKWPGIILNIIIYIFVTIFIYLILKKIITENEPCKSKFIIFVLISNIITLSTVNNVIFIRMYALSTLNIVIITYLHLKLLDNNDNKLLFLIGICALAGSLTHYYYLFYLAMLFIMFVIKYIKEKKYKELGKYFGTILLAGILSLIIFPYSIQHMFFGYRGQDAINNFFNVSKYLIGIVRYIVTINVYAFNNILWALLFLILGVTIYKKNKKIPLIEIKNKYIKYIMFPTGFYFLLVAVSAPFVTFRYVMPISAFILIIVMYYMLLLVKDIIKEKNIYRIMGVIVLLILIMPTISNKTIDFIIGTEFRNEKESLYASKQELVEKMKNESNIPISFFSNISNIINSSMPLDSILLYIKNYKIEPEVMYSNMSETINRLENDLYNMPALYIYNSDNDRFLCDILLFTIIDESYIAKDIEYSEENIRRIILDKNIRNGMIVFVNDGQENEEILKIIKETTGLKKVTYLQRLYACDVYCIN